MIVNFKLPLSCALAALLAGLMLTPRVHAAEPASDAAAIPANEATAVGADTSNPAAADTDAGSDAAAGTESITAVADTGEVTTPEAVTESAPQGERIGIVIAPKLGFSVPTSKLGTTVFGALDIGYRLPILNQLLGVGIELGWMRPGTSGSAGSATAGTYDYDVNNRLFMMAIEADAQVPVAMVLAYGGVGYGLYSMKTKVTAFGQSHTQTQTRAGLQLHGGAAYQVGPGEAFGEVRYHYTNLRFRITGHSNAGAFTTALGYRMTL